jgi:hypothetical protein
MALPSSGEIKASQINTEAGRSSSAEAPLSGSSSTPQAGSLVKIYEGAGVNQSAPHSYSEFHGITFVGVLTDVFFFPNPVAVTYYYSSSIGNAANLTIGDIIYTDSALTTTLTADTYYQAGSAATTTHCTSTSYQMSMTVNSSGAITNIFCAQP